jgi:hypothetical protein
MLPSSASQRARLADACRIEHDGADEQRDLSWIEGATLRHDLEHGQRNGTHESLPELDATLNVRRDVSRWSSRLARRTRRSTRTVGGCADGAAFPVIQFSEAIVFPVVIFLPALRTNF